jgi:ribulose-5-phosphate 4-epimerase/fuculose-1-phosphate aldolase
MQSKHHADDQGRSGARDGSRPLVPREVPIIENTPNEEDLTDGMREAMERYPDAPAILVRRHGVYVWGAGWEMAKTQCEVGSVRPLGIRSCYLYLR